MGEEYGNLPFPGATTFRQRPKDRGGVSDDGLITHTSIEQERIEEKCLKLLDDAAPTIDVVALQREDHLRFLYKALRGLGEGYSSLDASRPWLVYWTIHSLDLLGALRALPASAIERTLDFLMRCQDGTIGGFCGGPGQSPHLAPTYASVNAIVAMAHALEQEQPGAGHRTLAKINRAGLYKFLLQMKDPSGGFSTSYGGEVDSRSTYTAISVASLLNLLTPELVAGTAEYVVSCVRYEGGIGGEPGNEAHGGYTFCGLATLMLLGKTHLVDIDRMLKWAVDRQMRLEGGFQGRCNKLVDGCYSFWVGGLFPLFDILFTERAAARRAAATATATTTTTATPPSSSSSESKTSSSSVPPQSMIPSAIFAPHEWLFNQESLQRYLLICAQTPKLGGMRDKPGKHADLYHTCYCLSGLSVAQHSLTYRPYVLGGTMNEVRMTNPLYNICSDAVPPALVYFGALLLPSSTSSSSSTAAPSTTAATSSSIAPSNTSSSSSTATTTPPASST